MDFERLGEFSYRISMNTFVRLVRSPFEASPWDCDTFTVEDVLAVPFGDECAIAYDSDVQNMVVGQSGYHIARIAYLLRNWDVHDDEPEGVHFPVFSVQSALLGAHGLLDGNHRYAAALIAGHPTFSVDIFETPQAIRALLFRKQIDRTDLL